MSDLDEMQKRLKAIAEVVNAFKSESVQLRVVEVLLGQLGVPSSPEGNQERQPQKRGRRRKPAAKTDPSTKQGANPERKKPARKAARSSASPGSFAMLTELLNEGFFKTPKTIGAIVAHCGTSKGHHYKANEISSPLLRHLRSGKLKRVKNKDAQYEYTST